MIINSFQNFLVITTSDILTAVFCSLQNQPFSFLLFSLSGGKLKEFKKILRSYENV